MESDASSISVATLQPKTKRKRKTLGHDTIKTWLVKNAPIKKIDQFHPSYTTERLKTLQGPQSSENGELIAKISIQIKQDLLSIQKAEIDSLQKRFRIAENILRLAECYPSKLSGNHKRVPKDAFFEMLYENFNIGQKK